MVKNYLWVFVNCLIENPAFDSQVGVDWETLPLQHVAMHCSTWQCTAVHGNALQFISTRQHSTLIPVHNKQSTA